MTAYRLAAEALPLAWSDAETLWRSPLMRPIADQLYRAVGSIGANLAEGYSRNTGRDRARFFSYALGSTRECIHWYRAASPVLDAQTVASRCATLARVRSLILATIRNERREPEQFGHRADHDP